MCVRRESGRARRLLAMTRVSASPPCVHGQWAQRIAQTTRLIQPHHAGVHGKHALRAVAFHSEINEVVVDDWVPFGRVFEDEEGVVGASG